MKTQFPQFIYGTAWKEERTQNLVDLAVKVGFRAVDTANQKKHYREDFTGETLKDLYKEIARDQFWLQSKYTYVRGQDHRLPYNPDDDYPTQVKASFQSTLKNLHTHYVDSYLLHGPMNATALTDVDWQVWKAMEQLHTAGQAKVIGISNVNLLQLKELFASSEIKPMTVQNRCYAEQGWNRDVREFCLENKIIYQGFSLLTANRQVLTDQRVRLMADKYSRTVPQIIFCFCKQVGMLPITGTSNETHMQEDLNGFNFELTSDEVQFIETSFLI
ncbi:MAG: aldo/keto reductase [Bdellovibrionota bacterium]